MNTYKLTFEETARYEHEIIINTDLSWDELDKLIDRTDFFDCNIRDAAHLLEESGKVKIKEIIESDPLDSEIECTDLNEIDEEEE